MSILLSQFVPLDISVPNEIHNTLYFHYCAVFSHDSKECGFDMYIMTNASTSFALKILRGSFDSSQSCYHSLYNLISLCQMKYTTLSIFTTVQSFPMIQKSVVLIFILCQMQVQFCYENTQGISRFMSILFSQFVPLDISVPNEICNTLYFNCCKVFSHDSKECGFDMYIMTNIMTSFAMKILRGSGDSCLSC
jgi:hypothetical protein